MFSEAGGVGVGTYAGWVIAGGAGPMLFVWVPAGMLLFGLATGIAMGIQNGLRDRIYNAIMGKKGNVRGKRDVRGESNVRPTSWEDLSRNTGGTQGTPSIA